MGDDSPRLSVGLAVRNGEPYLEQAIDSILAQTYKDFELIISDNASTDRTAEICQTYAAIDSRIRYSRNAVNIGGANNENRTVVLARGKYFRWAAHDDACGPELFEKCIAVLDNDPSVVLCTSQINEIDEHGDLIATISRNLATSTRAYRRFRDMASLSAHWCEATYGIVRLDVLRQTRLEQNYFDSDRTLLCELSLHGRFHEISEPLFFKRYHPKNTQLDPRARMAWFCPDRKGKITFPRWLQFRDLLTTIHRAPISMLDRVGCYGIMADWLLRMSPKMAKDVLVALSMWTRVGRWKKQDEGLYNWE